MSRTTITDEIVNECRRLASIGFSNVMISNALGMTVYTLSRNKQLKQAIQEGKRELAEKVTQTILENIGESQNATFIAKRLNLFNPQINIKKPNDAKEALDNLSIAIKQYADGEINESQLRTIEAVSNSYIKCYEFAEFEERIKRLEDDIEKQKKNRRYGTNDDQET